MQHPITLFAVIGCLFVYEGLESSMSSQNERMKIQRLQDALFVNSTRFFAALVLFTLTAIIASLIYGAMPSIKAFGLSFITSSDWNPVTDQFGAWPSIRGTLLSAFIALVIAVPVSFGIAIFLTELSPMWLRRPLGIAIELLAGIPSIVYGMWGLFVFAPYFADNIQPWMMEKTADIPFLGELFTGAPMGIGMFTAGLILSVMVIPYVASVMRDVFEIVPPMLKESAYGLGATRWEVIRNVVVPYTKTGIIGGIMLGLGRALGETMAITFVIGNSQQISNSLFDPATTISATLANEFTEAHGELYTSSLIELGLLLFFITFVVLVLSKLLLMRLESGEGSHS
jgi:phosphate transport system permease protein